MSDYVSEINRAVDAVNAVKECVGAATGFDRLLGELVLSNPTLVADLAEAMVQRVGHQLALPWVTQP